MQNGPILSTADIIQVLREFDPDDQIILRLAQIQEDNELWKLLLDQYFPNAKTIFEDKHREKPHELFRYLFLLYAQSKVAYAFGMKVVLVGLRQQQGEIERICKTSQEKQAAYIVAVTNGDIRFFKFLTTQSRMEAFKLALETGLLPLEKYTHYFKRSPNDLYFEILACAQSGQLVAISRLLKFYFSKNDADLTISGELNRRYKQAILAQALYKAVEGDHSLIVMYLFKEYNRLIEDHTIYTALQYGIHQRKVFALKSLFSFLKEKMTYQQLKSLFLSLDLYNNEDMFNFIRADLQLTDIDYASYLSSAVLRFSVRTKTVPEQSPDTPQLEANTSPSNESAKI